MTPPPSAHLLQLPALLVDECVEGVNDIENLQGGGLWTAAVVLADMCIPVAIPPDAGTAADPALPPVHIDCTGAVVLELGAGCGFAGLAAGRWGGAKQVWLTDQLHVTPHIRRNVAINQAAVVGMTEGGGPDMRVAVLDFDVGANPYNNAGPVGAAGAVTPAGVGVGAPTSGNYGVHGHGSGSNGGRNDETSAVPDQADIILGADILFSWCPGRELDLFASSTEDEEEDEEDEDDGSTAAPSTTMARERERESQTHKRDALYENNNAPSTCICICAYNVSIN